MNDIVQRIEHDVRSLPSRVEVIFHGKEQDRFSAQLMEYLQALCEASEGKLVLRRAAGRTPLPERPAFTLKADGRQNVHYLALPEANEVAPFLKALRFVATGEAPFGDDLKRTVGAVRSPAEIQIFVSSFCTNCPRVVETVVAFAALNPMLSAFVIDVQRFAELAERYAVKSVPATVVDRELVLIGQVSPERLSSLLERRGGEDYEREVLRSMLERGLTAEAAERIREGKGREALVSLFLEPELSTRMGVLVVLGQVLEKDREALTAMVPSLLGLLSHDDARIRGDVADFLGGSGDARAIPHLERLTQDPDPEVAEAASDALDRLRGRAGE